MNSHYCTFPLFPSLTPILFRFFVTSVLAWGGFWAAMSFKIGGFCPKCLFVHPSPLELALSPGSLQLGLKGFQLGLRGFPLDLRGF